MALPLSHSAVHHNAPTSTLVVDLSSIATACPADERSQWQTLSDILDEAMLAQAEEIHLEPDNDCFRIRIRSAFSFSERRMEEAGEYMASLELLQSYLFKEPSDTSARRAWFAFTADSGQRLIQLDVIPTSRGGTFKLTLLHDLKAPPARLEELPLSKRQQSQLRKLLKQKSGLILLASDHAQARAMTARALAQELVAPDRKIAFADIPGHPMIPRVTQLALDNVATPEQKQIWPAICELGCDAIVSWQTPDEHVARQLARQANEATLIIQGLGVNTAADAMDQLLGMGVRSETIARSLSAIIVQRRLQSLCTYCREAQAPDDQGTAWLAEHSPIKAGNINDWLRHRMRSSFSHAPGCERCHDTGCGSTLDLYAIVTLDEEVRDALYDMDIRFALNSLREINYLSRDLMKLAQEGIISLAEAARIAPPVLPG